MKKITYDLRLGQNNSDEYYKAIKGFSKTVFTKIESELGYLISNLENFIAENNIEKIRSRSEYAVEILTIGMVWNRYLGASQRTSVPIIALTRLLFNIRRKNQVVKPLIDTVRGLIAGLFLVPKINTKPKNNHPNMSNFSNLIKWIEATGEFKDETKRLKIWKNFFKNYTNRITELHDILEVFAWFEPKAKECLGKYTANVDSFLKSRYKEYKYREDVIFCGKEEVEYHLNMVGAEVMNWGFETDFRKTKKKVVLVPDCMSISKENCKAVRNGLDITCALCNKKCKIYEMTKLGKQLDFDVFLVPHSSSFTKWLKRWENNTEKGLIAVACLLNLVPGGYEMRELNIPSQCILLDYCGCKKHWDAQGISTDLNKDQLVSIIKKS